MGSLDETWKFLAENSYLQIGRVFSPKNLFLCKENMWYEQFDLALHLLEYFCLNI